MLERVTEQDGSGALKSQETSTVEVRPVAGRVEAGRGRRPRLQQRMRTHATKY
jgi:hypothetical protein